jgi:hypothetical protein
VIRQIVRSRTLWIGIVIGLLGVGAYWFPMLRVPIAILTILGAWMQGYENAQAQKDMDAKYAEARNKINESRSEILTKHAAAMEEINKSRTEALAAIKDARFFAQALNMGSFVVYMVLERFVFPQELRFIAWLHRQSKHQSRM